MFNKFNLLINIIVIVILIYDVFAKSKEEEEEEAEEAEAKFSQIQHIFKFGTFEGKRDDPEYKHRVLWDSTSNDVLYPLLKDLCPKESPTYKNKIIEKPEPVYVLPRASNYLNQSEPKFGPIEVRFGICSMAEEFFYFRTHPTERAVFVMKQNHLSNPNDFKLASFNGLVAVSVIKLMKIKKTVY